MSVVATYSKDPEAVLDYEIDWSEWLGSLTIVDSEWDVPTGITADTDSNTTTATIVRLSSGVDGEDYECVNTITTSNGQEDQRSILIQVRAVEFADVMVVATVGGASSNSYVTALEAAAYFASRLDSSVWDAATGIEREKALITATAQLDQSAFLGMRTTATQRLAFPRLMIWMIDSYAPTYWPSDAIPQPIKDATCELAQELLTSSVTSSEVGSLASVTMGDMLTVNFDNSTAGTLSSRVAALLRGFWLNASGVAMVRS